MKELLRRLIFPDTYSSEAYVKTLRNRYGIDIGENCMIWSPNKVYIDVQRPHLLHIGDYVKIASGVNIICHDYSRSVLMGIPGYENVGEAREVYIGDNVFIGLNAIILMGSVVGDNCIIGAGSVVSGKFENNSIITGNPAKRICSLEEFYRRRKEQELNSAKLYVKKWKEKYGRYPSVNEMTNAFSWLYIPHTVENLQKNTSLFNYNGINTEMFKYNYLNTNSQFNTFDEFLEYCKKE